MTPRTHFKIRKPTHKMNFYLFWYIHIGILTCATEFMGCTEILLASFMEEEWSTFGDTLVQLK